MLKNEPKQYNVLSILYNKIPENHILKSINKVVDFTFINEMLEDSYCKYYGRPAREPEMMIKLSVLQCLYNLSDVKVIEESNLNIAYLWFLGVNPDEELPDPSLLAKFRKMRLKEVTLDDIITEIVRQCVEKGIIQSGSISIDATHTQANTKKKVPERIMKHLARKILKNFTEEGGEITEQINDNIPDYKEIEDHNVAKAVMKEYVETLAEQVEKASSDSNMPETKAAIKKAREVLESPQFIQQKGIRSLIDEDARVGRKSKKESFFGYKTEFTMLTDEKIITAVNVYNGAYVDGTGTKELLERTSKAGIDITEMYGDKAYFRKPILDEIAKCNATAYIPVSETVYKIDESKYTYNKDSDEWYCTEGNRTEKRIKAKRKKNGKEFETYKYYFDIQQCRNCPRRQECTGKAKRKILHISINTPEFYELSQRQKTKEFKEKYKQRAYQEGKNGEMKQHHGLARATGYGLRSMQIQAKLTTLAVNLKRIAKIASSLNQSILLIFPKYWGLTFLTLKSA